ncbi:MAG: zf-HC2 domain-containing protein [Armatimonadota bacterium]
MSCNTSQSKLSAYVDGEMSGMEMQSIRRHVSHCPDCQGEVDGLKSVQMVLRGLPPTPEAPPNLPDRITASIKTTRRHYLRYALVVAVPLCAFAVIFYPRSTPKPTQDRDLVIHRQLAKDQIFDAGTDSTSGASLVHYANLESR